MARFYFRGNAQNEDENKRKGARADAGEKRNPERNKARRMA